MNDRQEPRDALPEAAHDAHRALSSLKEEIEAVDFYHERVLACGDSDLKRVLEHNRNEEMEHAAMLLEWLRRNMTAWDGALRTYLFTTTPIAAIEARASDTDDAGRVEGIGAGPASGSPVAT